MKKSIRLTAVLSAAALLTLGASMSAFASSKGTWMMVDGERYCYDSNGDIYENTFCSSNGSDYYVGDDGTLVRSDWVEYDGDYYFVDSSGKKVVNDWRLVSPYDDPDADEEWYYFQASGQMASSKKLTWKGNTYFFDSEGCMLTGWVTSDGTGTVDEANDANPDTTYYCGEDGACLKSSWIWSTAPGTDEDDADADEYYYYLKSTGKLATGKVSSIGGQTYLFNEEGQMLSGWVACDGEKYMEIDGEDSSAVLTSGAYQAVYYCGEEDDGHVKKGRWAKLWRPADAYDEDDDNDKYWYWIDRDGKVFIPSDSNAAFGCLYELEDASLTFNGSAAITKKKINSKDYFFNQNGEMLSDFVEVTAGSSDLAVGMYYFGGEDDGSMKTGSQSVKDDNGDIYKFYFATASTTTGESKGAGITGNKSNKLYYKGLLIQAEDYKYQTATIDGHTFIVNQSGTIQHSQVQYLESGDVLIDAKTVTENGETVYEIVYSTASDQWKYSVDEEASTGVLKDYNEPIDITAVMNTISE